MQFNSEIVQRLTAHWAVLSKLSMLSDTPGIWQAANVHDLKDRMMASGI